MKSVLLQPIIMALLVVLMSAGTQTTPEPVTAKTLLKSCTFDVDYTSLWSRGSKFWVEAYALDSSQQKWKYTFDVKEQTVRLVNTGAAYKEIELNYRTNNAHSYCRQTFPPTDPIESNVDLPKSMTLPSTFPPSDSVYCDDGDDDAFYTYYSEKYDFLITVKKINKSNRCQIFVIGLPGEKKPQGKCVKSDGKQPLWTFSSYPTC